jgi:hypothetical protein
MPRRLNTRDDGHMLIELKAEVKSLRDALEFYERLVILKTNRYMNLSNPGYEPIARLPREHFADYVLRVRKSFPENHKLPRERLRKQRLMRALTHG